MAEPDMLPAPSAARHPGTRSRMLALLLLTLAAAVHAGDLVPAESARIEYLIAVVASLPGAPFVRNGTAYDARAAVDHLRLKLRLAGARVKTAEDFILYCASESSVSGRPYEIRLADGRVVPSAQFLRQKLLEFDQQNGGGSTLPGAAARG